MRCKLLHRGCVQAEPADSTVPKCGNYHIPMYGDSQSNRGHWCGHSKHGEHNMAGNHRIQTVVPVQAHLRSSANIDNVIETLSGGYCHTVMVIHHIHAEIHNWHTLHPDHA